MMIRFIVLVVVLLMISLSLFAQPPGPQNDVPIDGASGMLLAGGLLMAGYHIRKKYNSISE